MPKRAAADDATTITSTRDAVETAIDLSKETQGGWEELTILSKRRMARWTEEPAEAQAARDTTGAKK